MRMEKRASSDGQSDAGGSGQRAVARGCRPVAGGPAAGRADPGGGGWGGGLVCQEHGGTSSRGEAGGPGGDAGGDGGGGNGEA
eukprot:4633352-Pleurochrysis_carterae.AAC.2